MSYGEKSKSLLAVLLKYFNTKERALKTLSGSTGIGLLALTIYYGELRFTPEITLAQGAFLVFQTTFFAFVILLLLTVVMSAPALVYLWMGIHPDDYPRNYQTKVRETLFVRSVTVQACVAATVFLAVYDHELVTTAGDLAEFAAWVLAVGSACFAVSTVCPDGFGRPERFRAFLASVGGIAFFFLPTIYLFLTLVDVGSAHSDGALRWLPLMGPPVIIVATSVLSTVRKSESSLWFAFPVVIVAQTLWLTQSITYVPRVVANAVGISETKPVVLALPPLTCAQVKMLHPRAIPAECDHDWGGRWANVELLNSVGAKWLARALPDQELIEFPGKDVTIERPTSK